MQTPPTQTPEQLLAEAAAWFARIHDMQTTEAAREEFASWLLRSPEHVGAFLSITRTWSDIGLTAAAFSAQELANSAREEDPRSNIVVLPSQAGPVQALQLQGRSSSPAARPGRPSRRFMIAASLAAAAAVLAWHGIDRWLHPSQLRTAIGEQRRTVLADGSIVQLNTDSELVIDLAPHERRIRLERGEARFTVAPDRKRPFLVTTPQATVRALGTVFNVQIATQRTEVAVLEGHVEVRSQIDTLKPVEPTAHASEKPVRRGDSGPEQATPAPVGASPVILTAGEQAAVTTEGTILPNAGPPFDRVRAWTEQRLIFHDDDLATVVAEVNRYHESSLRIADAQTAALRISGTFAAQDVPSLVLYLERYRNVRAVKISDGSLLLKLAEPQSSR